MAADIGQIAQLLDATLDPTEHRKAETALKQEATKPQYSLSLLNIVNSDTLPPKTRLAAALAFKNFIRTNYVDEEGNYKLPQDEVQVIKERLIGLMISSPPIFRPSLVTLSALLQTLISGDDGIPLHRNSSVGFPLLTPRSTLVFSRLHTLSLPDGDLSFEQTNFTWRSIM
ncbi:importin-alpha export receptor [Fusarium oxysporum]|nr:importin-alpha export receptor [Fusarium oxysporum]